MRDGVIFAPADVWVKGLSLMLYSVTRTASAVGERTDSDTRDMGRGINGLNAAPSPESDCGG